MKIEDNRHWESNPIIYVEDDEFEISIERDNVEIECRWDYGYGGRGTERMYIDRKKLIELLELIDKPIDKER